MPRLSEPRSVMREVHPIHQSEKIQIRQYHESKCSPLICFWRRFNPLTTGETDGNHPRGELLHGHTGGGEKFHRNVWNPERSPFKMLLGEVRYPARSWNPRPLANPMITKRARFTSGFCAAEDRSDGTTNPLPFPASSGTRRRRMHVVRGPKGRGSQTVKFFEIHCKFKKAINFR